MIGNEKHFYSAKPDAFLYGGPDDGREVYLYDDLTLIIETNNAVYSYDSSVQRYVYMKDRPRVKSGK